MERKRRRGRKRRRKKREIFPSAAILNVKTANTQERQAEKYMQDIKHAPFSKKSSQTFNTGIFKKYRNTKIFYIKMAIIEK